MHKNNDATGISLEGKDYTACVMIFSPHGNANIISGKTEKVTEYWDSIEDCDYDFHSFHTEREMEEGIRKIASEETPYITWIFYQVEDCLLGEYPPSDKGIELGNPFGKLVFTESKER